jgi:tetratricopeptide (TPR) repeat protein
VSRALLAALLWTTLAPGAAQPPEPKPREQAAPVEPAEEDEAFKKKEYAFNPLQAEQELKVGGFYFKKGSYKAAAARFEEATLWNPGSTEAWLRLGEAREKLKDAKGARLAFEKYLELAPDGKEAKDVRKKLPGLR